MLDSHRRVQMTQGPAFGFPVQVTSADSSGKSGLHLQPQMRYFATDASFRHVNPRRAEGGRPSRSGWRLSRSPWPQVRSSDRDRGHGPPIGSPLTLSCSNGPSPRVRRSSLRGPIWRRRRSASRPSCARAWRTRVRALSVSLRPEV